MPPSLDSFYERQRACDNAAVVRKPDEPMRQMSQLALLAAALTLGDRKSVV